MPILDGAVALLGDAHLRESDGEVPAFVRFLDTLPRDVRTLAILGDLFAVWIGLPDLVRRHHHEVVAALKRLRARGNPIQTRSEEHTSELQSRLHLVCRLLLEKKNIYT